MATGRSRKLARNDRVEFGLQGAAYALFSPDRSPSSAAQQFLSQFSSWKPATGAGSDLEMLNVFLEAARKLNTSGVLDDALQTLLEAALRLTHAERGFVFLRDPDGELRLAAGRDKKGESIHDDSAISRSALRDAAKSASEFLVTDTDDTGKLAGRESIVAHNLHSVICIPLRKTVIQDKAQDEEYRKALTIFQKLADDNPAVTDFRAPWRPATTASASCCRIRASQREAAADTARRFRSSRSWPTITPPFPGS